MTFPWRTLILAALVYLPTAPAAASEEPSTPRPLVVDALALAEDLAADPGRVDEALGVLLQVVEDDRIGQAARLRLRTLASELPPRTAWAEVYRQALLAGDDLDPGPVELAAAVARLGRPGQHRAALADLARLAESWEDDRRPRDALGEALLRDGQARRALEVLEAGRGAPELLAIARIAADSPGELRGLDLDEHVRPCAERRTPVTCAPALNHLGHPRAALELARAGLQGDRRTERRSR